MPFEEKPEGCLKEMGMKPGELDDVVNLILAEGDAGSVEVVPEEILRLCPGERL